MRLVKNNEIKQLRIGYLQYIKNIMKSGSIIFLGTIVGLSVHAGSTKDVVDKILNSSFKFLPQVNCNGSGKLKMACVKHQDKIKFHFEQSKKLAKLSDTQEQKAKSLDAKASQMIDSNPSLANKLFTKSNEEYLLSKETAAAAHAHVSAGIAQKKAAASTASYGALYNCENTNPQKLANCISSAAVALSSKVKFTSSAQVKKPTNIIKQNTIKPFTKIKNNKSSLLIKPVGINVNKSNQLN